MRWIGFVLVTAVVFSIFIRRDNPGPQFRVGGVDAMEPDYICSRSGNKCGEFAHEVDWIEDHSGRGSPTSKLHFQHQVGACLSRFHLARRA